MSKSSQNHEKCLSTLVMGVHRAVMRTNPQDKRGKALFVVLRRFWHCFFSLCFIFVVQWRGRSKLPANTQGGSLTWGGRPGRWRLGWGGLCWPVTRGGDQQQKRLSSQRRGGWGSTPTPLTGWITDVRKILVFYTVIWFVCTVQYTR